MKGDFEFSSSIKVDVIDNGSILMHLDILGEHRTNILKSQDAAVKRALLMLGWTPPDHSGNIVRELLEAAREALPDWKSLCDAAYNRDGTEYERLAKALEAFK